MLANKTNECDELARALAAANAELQFKSNRIHELNAELTKVKSDLRATSDELLVYKTKCEKYYQTIQTLERNEAELRAELSRYKDENYNARLYITKLEMEISPMKQDIVNYIAQIKNLTAEVDSYQSAVSGHYNVSLKHRDSVNQILNQEIKFDLTHSSNGNLGLNYGYSDRSDLLL